MEIFEKIREGSATILAPRSSLFKRPDGVYEPAWAPVFYNPAMKDNRSLTVLASIAYQQMFGAVKTFIEPLAGTCVRTIRVLLESNVERGYANDLDPLAAVICKYNIKINGLEERVTVFNRDANMFNYTIDSMQIPADFVDVDPYGTPIYYLQSSIKVIGKSGVLSVTATDLGTLEGKYPHKSLSRYGVKLHLTPFSKEVAVRVLLFAITKVASYLERSVEPLLIFYDKHYVKAVVKIQKASSSKVRENLMNLGYLNVDEAGNPVGVSEAEDGGLLYRKARYLGPLWIGKTCDRPFLSSIISLISQGAIGEADRQLIKKLKLLYEECDIDVPYYYNLHYLFKATRANVPKTVEIIDKLKNRGYKAARTHFDPLAVKTDAPLKEVITLLK